MSKAAVDAVCKVILNFLIWAALAAIFRFSSIIRPEWAVKISEIFKDEIDYFPLLAMPIAIAMLGIVVFVVAKKTRANTTHRNKLLGELLDEVGAIITSFGSVLFFTAATNWCLYATSAIFLIAGGLLFRFAIKLGT